MQVNPPPDQLRLIRQTTLCQRMDLSANGLAKLRAKDPTFPQPIKFGDSRQAPVFYDEAEWQSWLETKKAERGAA